MPTVRYLGLARGAQLGATPTVSASTTSLAVEVALTIDDGAGGIMTRDQAVLGVDRIRAHLVNCAWPIP